MRKLCQCPERGNLYFSRMIILRRENDYCVSMPWKGQPLFLPMFLTLVTCSSFLCQCPERGNLYFSGLRKLKRRLKHVVSMPWKGQPLFLQEATKKYKEKTKRCVNALKGATFISPSQNKISICHRQSCVNALKGATFISPRVLWVW